MGATVDKGGLDALRAVTPGRKRRRRARERLRAFLEHPATDIAVIVLILTSVALLVAEAVLPAGSLAHCWCLIAGDLITVVFAVELSARFLVARSKRHYLRSYWVDILAVLPLLRVLRVLRVLRLLRVFRAGALLNRRLSLFSGSFRESAAEVLLVGTLLVVFVLAGAIGVHALEGDTKAFADFDRSFWWSFFSFMAGEPVNGMPKTAAGKVLTVVVMIGGMTVFAMLTGVVSAALVHRMRKQMSQRQGDLSRLRDHVVICGWNRAGARIIEELQFDPEFRRRGILVVAELERQPELGDRIQDPGRVFFVSGDYTRLDVLNRCRIAHARVAILLADKSQPRSDQDRDARTVLAAMLVEKHNPAIFTCVELLHRDNEAHLRALHVEEIVNLDDYGANIIAAASRNQGLVTVFNELFTSEYGNEFCKVVAGPDQVGEDVRTVGPALKESHNALLVAVERTAEDGTHRNHVNPPQDFVIEAGDRLVIITDQPPRRD